MAQPESTSPAPDHQVLALPTLISISPTSGSAQGGNLATLSGTSLQHVIQVQFGGNGATNVTAVNATTVTCITPSGGIGPCQVFAFDDTGNRSNAVSFTYVQ